LPQQRPGAIAPATLESLRRLVPLAPVIAIQSSWCSGEARSGRPLPGVLRVPWDRFEAEILPGLLELRDGRLPPWAGPATLTAEERLLAEVCRALPSGRGTVGIVAHAYEARRLLADVCRAGGWQVSAPVPTAPGADSLAARPQFPCDVLLWDAGEVPNDVEGELARWSERSAGAPIVMLLAFAREQDIQRAQAAGAAALVSKPFSAGALLGEIDRAASRRGGVCGPE
jgi:CheY-like chemotaxis protein